MRVHVQSDAISSVGRAAHDISLGALIGGNLFARAAMHPAISLVSDPRERGREATAKRQLNMLGSAHLAATIGLAGVNAALSQASFRRPPKRRVLKRRY